MGVTVRQFLCILKKDLSLIVRDKAALFWVFVFPILFAGFFGAAMSSRYDAGDKTLSVAIVDAPAGEGRMAEFLGNAPGIEVHTIGQNEMESTLAQSATAAVVEIGASGKYTVHHDPGKQVEAMFVKSAMLEALGAKDLQVATKVSTIERSELYSFSMVFPAALMWGLMGCTAGFSLHLVQ